MNMGQETGLPEGWDLVKSTPPSPLMRLLLIERSDKSLMGFCGSYSQRAASQIWLRVQGFKVAYSNSYWIRFVIGAPN